MSTRSRTGTLGTGGCQRFFTAANLNDGMSDAAIVNAICDSVIANVNGYQYADSYRARYERERQTCLSYTAQHGDGTGGTQQPQEKPNDGTDNGGEGAPEEAPSDSYENADEKPEQGQQGHEPSDKEVTETPEQEPSQNEDDDEGDGESNAPSDNTGDGEKQENETDSGNEMAQAMEPNRPTTQSMMRHQTIPKALAKMAQ